MPTTAHELLVRRLSVRPSIVVTDAAGTEASIGGVGTWLTGGINVSQRHVDRDVNLIEEYRRAVLFMEAGDPIYAARILETVLEAEPGHSEVKLRLAMAYFASARLARAEGLLRELVTRDPSDHYAHHLLGRTLERQNKPGEALPHLRLAEAMAAVPDYGAAAQRVAARLSDH